MVRPFDHAHVSDDVFGNAYEHLIRNFASKAGKSSGEFYTPAEVAYLMAEIIEPQEGNSIATGRAAPAACSPVHGTTCAATAATRTASCYYAQESNVATYNISRINMILHGVKSWTTRARGQHPCPACCSMKATSS